MPNNRVKLHVGHAYELGFFFNWVSYPIHKTHWVVNLRHLIIKFLDCMRPIDYVRYREFEFVFSAITKYKPVPNLTLDIGSPKLLPLTMAHAIPASTVHSIDVVTAEVHYARSFAHYLKISNFKAEIQDARALPYLDNTFDLVTSVSVFEHIAPEKDGERPALRELVRVTAPGGIAVMTLPFSRLRFSEYKQGPIYERVSDKDKLIFFQRFYDLDLLTRNIIKASEMELLYLGFIEERLFFKDPHKRLAGYINSSRIQNLVFGPFFFLLSRFFLSAPRPLEKTSKPYIACLVMRKKTDG